VKSKITFNNRINFRILVVLIILIAAIAIVVAVLNQTNIRRVYESNFTDRVLMTNALIAQMVDSEDLMHYIDLLRNKDDAFKARQVQFFYDREELFELMNEGLNGTREQELLVRLEAFHREMDGFKTERYWRTIENLRELRDTSGSAYVYVITDTGLRLEDGTVLFTFLFDADDYGVYDSPYMDGLGTSNVVEESAKRVFFDKVQMEEVEYYEGDYGELYYAYAPIFGNDGEVIAVLGTDIDVVPMNVDISRSLTLFNTVFILSGIIIVLFIYIYIRRSVTAPLRTLTNTAQELSEGNVYAETPESTLNQNSEIGMLAHAIDNMSHVYQDMIESTEQLFNATNAGKLDVRNDVSKYKGDIQKVIRQINDTLDATTLYLNSVPESIIIMSKEYEIFFRNENFKKCFGEMTGLEFMSYVEEQGEKEVWINDSCYSVIQKGINLSDMADSSILIIAIDITDLIKEKENAQAATEAKSDFLSRMSHEMRTPMNAIIGMTKIAEKTEDLDKLKYCLSTIETSSMHLLNIINDVLDMSKIEAGKIELEPVPLNIRNMLNKICHIVQDSIEKKNQDFNVKLEEGLELNYIADELRISQVLTNLLSNAVKFTPENGKITLGVRNTGCIDNINTLVFSVKDTGIGLSEEQQKRLFVAFEQADGSISRKYGGTGLGLAISRSIAEKMGGRIWVESAPKKGSVFNFEVPLELAPKNHAVLFDVDKPLDSDKKKFEIPDFSDLQILLAEDIDINRDIFLALLEETNIKIDTCGNGLEAVSMFKDDPDRYALIIMDVQMPEMDGYQATQAIRAMDLPRAKTIPIIAMTANAFKEDVDRCLESGMNDHLAKPINEKLVIEKILQYTS